MNVSWPTRNRRLTKANFARNQPTPAQRRNPRGFRHFQDSRLSGLLAETRNKFRDTMGHELMAYFLHSKKP